jgi:uncharacterized protein (DUF1778 family)
MSDQSQQISATVSAATNDKLESDEALIPARIVLDDKAFDRVVTLLETPAAPTAALRELMRGEGR